MACLDLINLTLRGPQIVHPPFASRAIQNFDAVDVSHLGASMMDSGVTCPKSNGYDFYPDDHKA